MSCQTSFVAVKFEFHVIFRHGQLKDYHVSHCTAMNDIDLRAKFGFQMCNGYGMIFRGSLAKMFLAIGYKKSSTSSYRFCNKRSFSLLLSVGKPKPTDTLLLPVTNHTNNPEHQEGWGVSMGKVV